ncbi:hypothetical protein [Leuconostoc miyukkimchii]|uniref:hypothetical protein n=1 Tax=Leuconostoc miyukkimchii TaxID=910540 RepID=UPI001C7DB116|nr:hypothetical protein [Leuconostoc miyukkimchii]
MKEKVGIYFYKNLFGQNKYICIASANGALAVDSLFGTDSLSIKKKVPKLNLGTYLMVDELVFKI